MVTFNWLVLEVTLTEFGGVGFIFFIQRSLIGVWEEGLRWKILLGTELCRNLNFYLFCSLLNPSGVAYLVEYWIA